MDEHTRPRGATSRRWRVFLPCLPLVSLGASLVPACTSDSPPGPSRPPPPVTPQPPAPEDFCSTPGSIVFGESGKSVVPGGASDLPDLSWLTLPSGFCAHHFARVPVARQIRFAPGGELFVASPVQPTTGAGTNGLAAVVAVPDYNRDWMGDAPMTYLTNAPGTQGLLFVPGWLYYQDGTKIRRRPFVNGDFSQTSAGAGELVADITLYQSTTHWPKALDVADDGTLYVSNGGDQGEVCDPQRLTRGGILVLDGTPGGRPIVKGMRNPIAMRCQRGKNQCFAVELSRDYSAPQGGREKLVPIREGDDWGFPCCATKDMAYPDVAPTPDCTGVASEDNAFVIGETPFGFDFAPGKWPGRWASNVLLTLHGAFGTWIGARVVAIATDPATGKPLPSPLMSTETDSAALANFATGWDDGTRAHGRPADATFAPDGRLFIANDVDGEIFWVAPVTNPVRSVGETGPQRDASTSKGGTGGGPHGSAADAGLGCGSKFVSLTQHVQPLFDRYCTGCHAPPIPSEKLDLSASATWSSTVNVSSRQCSTPSMLIAPGDPDQSYLWRKLQGQDLCNGSAPMPPTGAVPSADELEIVRSWICMGAPYN